MSEKISEIVARCREKEKAESAEHEKRLAEYRKRQAADRDVLVSGIRDAGGKEIETNGYVFDFVWDDYRVRFVNQSERLCCTIHFVPRNDTERGAIQICARDPGRSRHGDGDTDVIKLAEAVCYRDPIFNGSADSSLHQLISYLHDLPKRPVAAREGGESE